jgi:chromosome segregation ATPase
MVEEAAGTKMYETKKQETQKTIIKKDAKLKELNDVSFHIIRCVRKCNVIVIYR